MKKILLLSVTLLLSSCFGSTADTTSLKFFHGNGFSIQVPSAWIAVPESDLPKPKNGTIALALTSTDISSGFANNLLILSDKLTPDADPKMTSRKYSVVNQALTTGGYLEYVKLSDTTIAFSDNDEGLVVLFEAKYNESTPKQKFLQTAKLCGKNLYLMTIGLNLDNADTAKYEDILKTFSCAAK